jgi:hypothetical protein
MLLVDQSLCKNPLEGTHSELVNPHSKRLDTTPSLQER